LRKYWESEIINEKILGKWNYSDRLWQSNHQAE